MPDVTIQNLPTANVIVPSVDVLPLVTGTDTLVTRKVTPNQAVASILLSDPLFSISATASGTLPNGSTVIVNTDGTVSQVAGSVASVGASNAFLSGEYANMQACWVAASSVIALTYQSTTDDTIQVIAGTISGDTITFGTAEELAIGAASAGTFPTIATYGATNTVVVTYSPGINTYLYAVAVQIASDASITAVGVPEVVETLYQTLQAVTASYFASLSGNGRLIIAYQTTDGGIRAVTASLSGTSLTTSFSSQLSTSSSTANITLGYYNGKIVALYENGSGAGITLATFTGTALTTINIINLASFDLSQGTFASTLLSNGNMLVAFSEANTIALYVAVFSINYSTFTAALLNEKVINPFPAVGRNAVAIYQYPNGISDVFYEDVSTGSLIAATVQVNPGGIIQVNYQLDLVQNALATSVFVSPTGSSYQTVVLYDSSSSGQNYFVYNASNSNMTDTNFLGFAFDDYTSGETAIVKTVGSVVTGLSGLVTGSHYYVIETGALSTTSGNPIVNAGTAISTTSLLMNN